MNPESVESIQFRDEYVIVETTQRTYTIKHTDIGDIGRGWLDNIQASAISLAKFPYLRTKYYESNDSNINQRFNEGSTNGEG